MNQSTEMADSRPTTVELSTDYEINILEDNRKILRGWTQITQSRIHARRCWLDV